jgi:hypothetical protein
VREMHNRARSTRDQEAHEPVSVRVLQALKYKAYRESAQRLLTKHDFAKAEKLLRSNPEFLTLWNARRRDLLALVSQDPDQKPAILQRELVLTQVRSFCGLAMTANPVHRNKSAIAIANRTAPGSTDAGPWSSFQAPATTH